MTITPSLSESGMPPRRVWAYIGLTLVNLALLVWMGWLPFLWIGTIFAMAAGGVLIAWRDGPSQADQEDQP